jgi:hypothetical protein
MRRTAVVVAAVLLGAMLGIPAKAATPAATNCTFTTSHGRTVVRIYDWRGYAVAEVGVDNHYRLGQPDCYDASRGYARATPIGPRGVSVRIERILHKRPDGRAIAGYTNRTDTETSGTARAWTAWASPGWCGVQTVVYVDVRLFNGDLLNDRRLVSNPAPPTEGCTPF